MLIKRTMFGAMLLLGLAAGQADASTVAYDISWTGSNSYSLTGSFSFDDALAGSLVEKNELISFSIEGFQGTASLGTFNGTPFYFNFDAVNEVFPAGARQIWNLFGLGIGFASEQDQLLLFDGLNVSDSRIFGPLSTLLATPAVSPVPVPAALPLLASALGAFGFIGWRKKRKTAVAAA